MPPPAKRVKATTYRRDSPEVTQWLWLVFMQMTRDVFAIAKFLSVFMTYLESAENQPNILRIMSRRKSAGKNRPAEIGRKSAEKLGQPAANVKKIRLRV